MIFQIGSLGTGAGHGAPGGSVSGQDGGDVYDTTKLPYQQGSGGGSGSGGTGGTGGGYFKAKIYELLEVQGTVKFLNFQTPETFAVIYLKFKLRSQSSRYFIK